MGAQHCKIWEVKSVDFQGPLLHAPLHLSFWECKGLTRSGYRGWWGGASRLEGWRDLGGRALISPPPPPQPHSLRVKFQRHSAPGVGVKDTCPHCEGPVRLHKAAAHPPHPPPLGPAWGQLQGAGWVSRSRRIQLR